MASRSKRFKEKLHSHAEFYTIPARVLGIMSKFQIKITRDIQIYG